MVAVSSKVMTRVNTQIPTSGNQACRMVAAALASSGITNTQNHQYSQPMVKPAQWPMALSA
ncbi:hypothetical protein D3C77_665460 [compost metagenome]